MVHEFHKAMSDLADRVFLAIVVVSIILSPFTGVQATTGSFALDHWLYEARPTCPVGSRSDAAWHEFTSHMIGFMKSNNELQASLEVLDRMNAELAEDLPNFDQQVREFDEGQTRLDKSLHEIRTNMSRIAAWINEFQLEMDALESDTKRKIDQETDEIAKAMRTALVFANLTQT